MNKFTSAIFSFLRFILVIAVCIGVSFLIVWPLWKFSTSNARAYTVTAIILIVAVVIFVIVKKIIKKIMRKSSSKPKIRKGHEN